jgi:hypothetical protein
MNLNILKFFNIEKLLSDPKRQTQIAKTVVDAISKNMGEASHVQISQVEGEIICVAAKQVENEVWDYWKIPGKDFFNIGLPIDFSKHLLSLGSGDFSKYKVKLNRFENDLNINCSDETGIIFSGPCESLICNFIAENAKEIAHQIKNGKIETPTLPDNPETEN